VIVLDTNVISELMRPAPDRRVSAWIGARAANRIYTTALNKAEIMLGVELLPKGRRREALREAAEAMFADLFATRVVSFDAAASQHYATVVASRIRKGRPIETIDAEICAICRAHGATLATRNVTDFDDCDIDVVNPWLAA
jgi:predicted nucleic acid-binding protein